MVILSGNRPENDDYTDFRPKVISIIFPLKNFSLLILFIYFYWLKDGMKSQVTGLMNSTWTTPKVSFFHTQLFQSEVIFPTGPSENFYITDVFMLKLNSL